ncbi:ECF RNA polymerase sigma-E factor [Vibrio aerogenes CECT 7868]|uniref:ECF RNA polymerase sigma-E factor n=1 Tax=Vibrio aerogenes CECT 7868 TaxID=1216006 RepID=A0A1M5YI98_9VIBR|nr:RNA polymerase sigma factor RpoE [Vibrio aerogenes]SHI11736.1 ECF RNA polymerase sigma-E factor [Vibrio aerogenes CECT 7868]
MHEQLTDQVLIERIQNGDKQAFNLLVTKYQNKVCNLIARYVNNSGDVADVAQETFIKAYRAIPSFRGESAFYTWLYRIAVNTAKNYIVAQSRRPPANDIDAEDAEYYENDNILKEISNPENITLSKELKRAVFAAIDALPEDLKTAMTLRELDGLSYEEIAAVMDCPVGTVRSRIFRAREAVEKRISSLL